MSDTQSKKSKKPLTQANPLETLKDLGTGAAKSLKEDLIEKTPRDFMDQLFGPKPQKYSGEIFVGESLEIREIMTGEHEEKQRLRVQLTLERSLRLEEQSHINKKTNELKIQLKTIQEEVLILAQNTQGLSKEIQIATMQAPIEPGIYHLVFFEKLLEFIKSFRKKIEEASVWLHSTNTRAAKKNAWGARYKKHGAKYLLSGEHYLSRSAG
jgi:hypothetical protein